MTNHIHLAIQVNDPITIMTPLLTQISQRVTSLSLDSRYHVLFGILKVGEDRFIDFLQPLECFLSSYDQYRDTH